MNQYGAPHPVYKTLFKCYSCLAYHKKSMNPTTTMPIEFLVSQRNLLGAIAKWAVEQSPYHRPDNLEVVLDKVSESTKDIFATAKLGFLSMNYEEIRTFVKDHLRRNQEYLAWNERKNGNQSPYKFTSRYDGEGNPDDDFIDLEALERNVTNEIVRNGTEKPIPEILGSPTNVE